MTARRILPHFSGPSQAKNSSRLASERSWPAEPDGAAPLQVADHDAVLVPLGDGDLVDADHLGSGQAGLGELLPHVLLVQPLDRVPVQEQLFGYLLDRRRAATPPHEEGEPPGVQRVVGEPVQLFALHAATPGAVDPAHREEEVDALVATG
jgi:hypothetical protein